MLQSVHVPEDTESRVLVDVISFFFQQQTDVIQWSMLLESDREVWWYTSWLDNVDRLQWPLSWRTLLFKASIRVSMWLNNDSDKCIKECATADCSSAIIPNNRLGNGADAFVYSSSSICYSRTGRTTSERCGWQRTLSTEYEHEPLEENTAFGASSLYCHIKYVSLHLVGRSIFVARLVLCCSHYCARCILSNMCATSSRFSS